MGNATWYNYTTLVSKRHRVDYKNEIRLSFIMLIFFFSRFHCIFCLKASMGFFVPSDSLLQKDRVPFWRGAPVD